ncbi:MAG TPA: acyl-ACP--UDP-N-acetylglucosamine O-acyltransferase [Thermoanaerobaculia bacterium]|nr:acyl-ACP--UDP-N-acetylglucosamine O-acyltransferase [Thermoanaerobaculia bacterium]
MSASVVSRIHPLAAVDPGAVLADGATVGPFAVIGPEVEIGEGTEVGAGAQIYGPARIGRENRIFPQAAIGFEPQDLKFGGERVSLEIGDKNQFREFCTIHRGTAKGGGVTRIGSDNLFMAYSHVAHDCQVGSRTIFANNATLAGHVEVHDDASISAFSAVHQFCRVGRHAYVGGYTVVVMDALPFAKTVGQKPAFFGINRIGLARKGVAPETIRRLDRALRLLVRSGLNTVQALQQMREELAGDPDVDYLIAFVESAKRGVHKNQGRGGRGGGAAAEGEGDA